MFEYPDDTYPMSEAQLRTTNKETQKRVMRTWFFSHFEDPVESTPYDSEEGGYMYIWGGPYDARDALFSEFWNIVPEDTILELAEELSDLSPEWARKPSADDIDEYFYDVVTADQDFYVRFQQSISDIRSLLDVEVEPELEQTFCKLLYVHVITAMETYLSDAFINTVMNNNTLVQTLVEQDPELKSRKFSLGDLLKRMDPLR